MWSLKQLDEYTYYKGGSAPVMPTDPQKEAEARNWEAEQQNVRDEAARKRTADEQAIKDQQSLHQWKSRAGNARSSVENYARDKLSGYGLAEGDSYGLWDKAMRTINDTYGGLADNEDFSSKLNGSVIDNLIADTRSNTRNKFSRDIKGQLGDNYLDDTFASTADDAILDELLGGQYTAAQGDLENARGRGQLNQNAYTRALESLTGAKSAARGKLETTGQSVLDSLKSGTKSVYDNLLTSANNFDFGDNFDVAGGVNRVKSKATEGLGMLDSKVREAVGDTKYFDVNSLIGKANAAGGVSNYVPNNGTAIGDGKNSLYTLFEDQQRNKQTEGAF